MSGMQILSGPVEKRSLDRAAADVLRQLIIDGSLPPGSRLTEIQISTQLDLSRGTIRAALQRLVFEGLVLQRPYSGWEVITLTPRDAWEVYTLRSGLEGLASRLAAANVNRGAAIEGAFAALKSAADLGQQKEIADADINFHKSIVLLANHQRLASHYGLLEQQLRMYVASSNAILESPKDVIANHEDLVAALLAGDEALSERFARQHNEKSGELLVRHLEKEAQTARAKAS